MRKVNRLFHYRYYRYARYMLRRYPIMRKGIMGLRSGPGIDAICGGDVYTRIRARIKGESGQYILVGQTPVPCVGLMEWGEWMQTTDRRVRFTKIGPYFISTVFLGLNHNFSRIAGTPHKPLLFETMAWAHVPEYEVEIFGHMLKRDREWLNHQERCSTWIEAEQQHQKFVDEIRTEYADLEVMEIFEDAEVDRIMKLEKYKPE